MKFKHRDDISPILLRALTKSNNRYKDELDNWLDDYKASVGEFDYEVSVTSLSRPPRERQLVQRHWDDIEGVDPMEMYFSMFGSGMHNVLENTAEEGEEVEVRRGKVLKIHLDGIANKDPARVLIHGQADYYCPMAERIDDYKYTSAWSVLRDKPDHEAQLNVLRYIWRQNDCPVEDIYNQYLFRDWNKKHLGIPNYPEEQQLYKRVPVWSDEKVLDYIVDRATKHIQSTELADDELPNCTKDEVWMSGDGRRCSYITKGTGEWNKKPTFVRNKEEYKAWKDKHPDVETKWKKVLGTPKRCEKYCFGSSFCSQYQQYKQQLEKENE